jgi:hydrogenase/urease accessory protein HupE
MPTTQKTLSGLATGLPLSRPAARTALLLLALLAPALAQAHSEVGAVGGFVSGFLHPMTGADHIAAMVAVGSGYGARLWRLDCSSGVRIPVRPGVTRGQGRCLGWHSGLAALAVLLLPAQAHAHSAVAGWGSIGAGLLHPLVTPPHLLLLLGLGLWCTNHPRCREDWSSVAAR